MIIFITITGTILSWQLAASFNKHFKILLSYYKKHITVKIYCAFVGQILWNFTKCAVHTSSLSRSVIPFDTHRGYWKMNVSERSPCCVWVLDQATRYGVLVVDHVVTLKSQRFEVFATVLTNSSGYDAVSVYKYRRFRVTGYIHIYFSRNETIVPVFIFRWISCFLSFSDFWLTEQFSRYYILWKLYLLGVFHLLRRSSRNFLETTCFLVRVKLNWPKNKLFEVILWEVFITSPGDSGMLFGDVCVVKMENGPIKTNDKTYVK